MGKSNLSFSKKFIMALQHLFTMAPATMVVPLILGNSLEFDSKQTTFLISANFFVNGIAALIESIGLGKKIGSRLPIVFGSSFALISPMVVIGSQYGIETVFGAVIVSALVMYGLSFYLDKVFRFFPPAVMGSFVTLIGISLAPIAMVDLAGGNSALNYGSVENLTVGLIVLLVVILLNNFGKGFVKATSLLIGIGTGTALAHLMGNLDVTSVIESNWVELMVPFKFGAPKFNLSAILIMTLFSVVNMIQCIGAFSVYEEVTGEEMSGVQKSNSMRSQIVAQAIGGVFGAAPTTALNGNIGLLGMTKVKDRTVIVITGFMLIIVGMIPKLASAITVIPKPALGGTSMVIFGIIIASGISILSKVDYSNKKNTTIVGTSLAIGIGTSFTEGIFDKLPSVTAMLLGDGLFMASVTAIILNILLNKEDFFK